MYIHTYTHAYMHIHTYTLICTHVYIYTYNVTQKGEASYGGGNYIRHALWHRHGHSRVERLAAGRRGRAGLLCRGLHLMSCCGYVYINIFTYVCKCIRVYIHVCVRRHGGVGLLASHAVATHVYT